MPDKSKAPKNGPHTHRHADGSVWAKGHFKNGKMHGAWVWFRKDGSKMRSGSFGNGAQTGKWTTWSASGKAVKVTDLTPKAKKKSAAKKKKKSAAKKK